jgi:hypothetical protein
MPERSGLRNVLVALLIVYAGARVLQITRRRWQRC